MERLDTLLFTYCGDTFAESTLISSMEFVTVMKINASLFQTPFFHLTLTLELPKLNRLPWACIKSFTAYSPRFAVVLESTTSFFTAGYDWSSLWLSGLVLGVAMGESLLIDSFITMLLFLFI